MKKQLKFHKNNFCLSFNKFLFRKFFVYLLCNAIPGIVVWGLKKATVELPFIYSPFITESN